ncbi:hypothetical protein L228DRAFT_260309 [Xylona heveae TC161]|uniref:BTB domain-containing protein n=1 Tax=Xylona heveae (strain CBS 132557 / TC161) TaxID=1328760 RepID=A0A165HGS1_XYLHT|nr:hypothetical protein L228DRAFT_260309 [Xylona heveae TC161]KZF23490.1 hypothetical protein L228DRAFT_260309 [Xylona heveae TC161]
MNLSRLPLPLLYIRLTLDRSHRMHIPAYDLRIHYRDFAYQNSRRLRMANPNISEATAKTFAELLSGPIVDIHVGSDENKRSWSLHRNLLCHHSDYFAEVFPEDAKKKSGHQLDLPEDDPGGFELLVKWLYQGRIDDVSDMPVERKWDYATACQKLYVLCERFNISQLKNVAMDQYRKGIHQAGLVPDPEEIKPIYDKAAPGSPFRKLVIRIAARQIMDPDQDKDAQSYRSCFEGNPDFAVDLVNAIREGAGGKLFADPTEDGDCEYHEHENGASCESKETQVNGIVRGRGPKGKDKGKQRASDANILSDATE